MIGTPPPHDPRNSCAVHGWPIVGSIEGHVYCEPGNTDSLYQGILNCRRVAPVCDNCGGDLPDAGYVLVAWRGIVWACCTRACARSLLDDDQRFASDELTAEAQRIGLNY